MEIKCSTSNVVEHRKKSIQKTYEVIEQVNGQGENDCDYLNQNDEEDYQFHESQRKSSANGSFSSKMEDHTPYDGEDDLKPLEVEESYGKIHTCKEVSEENRRYFFRQRYGALDWNNFQNIDIDSIISTGDVQQLQSVLDEVTFKELSVSNLPFFSPETIIKVQRMMQLIIEYILQYQIDQSKIIHNLRKDALEKQKNLDNYRNKLNSLTNDLLSSKKSLLKYQSFVSICKRILLKRFKGEDVKQIFDDTIVQHFLLSNNNLNKVDYDADFLISEAEKDFFTGIEKSSSFTSTTTPIHICGVCQKAFSNAEFLLNHKKKRNHFTSEEASVRAHISGNEVGIRNHETSEFASAVEQMTSEFQFIKENLKEQNVRLQQDRELFTKLQTSLDSNENDKRNVLDEKQLDIEKLQLKTSIEASFRDKELELKATIKEEQKRARDAEVKAASAQEEVHQIRTAMIDMEVEIKALKRQIKEKEMMDKVLAAKAKATNQNKKSELTQLLELGARVRPSSTRDSIPPVPFESEKKSKAKRVLRAYQLVSSSYRAPYRDLQIAFLILKSNMYYDRIQLESHTERKETPAQSSPPEPKVNSSNSNSSKVDWVMSKFLGKKSKKKQEESKVTKPISVDASISKQNNSFDHNAHHYILAFEDRIKFPHRNSDFDKADSEEFLQKLKEARGTVIRQLSEKMEKEEVPSDSLGLEDKFLTAYMDQVKVHRFAEENDSKYFDQYLNAIASNEAPPSLLAINLSEDPDLDTFNHRETEDMTEKDLSLEDKYEENGRSLNDPELYIKVESLKDISTSIDLTQEKSENISVDIIQGPSGQSNQTSNSIDLAQEDAKNVSVDITQERSGQRRAISSGSGEFISSEDDSSSYEEESNSDGDSSSEELVSEKSEAGDESSKSETGDESSKNGTGDETSKSETGDESSKSEIGDESSESETGDESFENGSKEQHERK